jgi:excisionase family DNA binding protein
MSAKDAQLLVTLTAKQLSDLVRDEVRAALAEQRPAAPPAVLTSEEAAAYLKMPVNVLRKRVRKGEVPSFKIGALLRFRLTDLDAWIDSLNQRKAG